MFTKHESGISAAYWDGDYRTYAELCHDEAEFVGVLDNSTGKEVLKVFTGSGWADCAPGHYVTKTTVEGKHLYGVIETPYAKENNASAH